jgi:hypothetical protein
MGRKFRINGKRVVDLAEVARAKYLDAKRIGGSRYVVTDVLYRAPFPEGSAGLRAAADKALVVEMESSIQEPKK